MARTAGSHSQITGPKIREAALRLFARHGYAAVSMRQIASEVGVQAGALYNYTPDKQSLLQDLMRVHMDDLLAELPNDLGPTPAMRLESFVRFHISFNTRRRDAIFISYMELRNLSSENFGEIEALRGRYERFLEDILADGVAVGEFAITDTKIATLGIIAMLNGVNIWYRVGGRLSLSQIQDQHWEMIYKSVKA